MMQMQLKVLLPAGVLVDQVVTKVTAEAENGFFCLKPRHVDFVAALVPGLLMFTDLEGKEILAAVDEGVLVKCGAEVLVSTRRAVLGEALEELRQTVEQHFQATDEHERLARTALARLEAGVVRRFIELEELL
jgi:F-type H+-transporting ATPase subunit epsilon